MIFEKIEFHVLFLSNEVINIKIVHFSNTLLFK